MASWVGTAKTLVGLKDQWHGTLMFIAQPAEEIGSGAKAMLADGLFTRFPKPDFGFALHANGAFAYGTVLYRVGIDSSNIDGLYIKFRGRGGHGAAPQATIDPVMVAARFVVDVQSVISREKDRPSLALSASVRSTAAPRQTSFPTMWCWQAPSAASSRRCAPRCSQVSSGQRRRSPPCRMRRSRRSRSPRAPRP